MKDVATDGGAGYGKHEISASVLMKLTEARGPLIMATERSVRYHQVTPPSSVCSSCYPSKVFLYSTRSEGLSKMQERVNAWFALWVLFAVNTMNFFDRQILGAVGEPIRREWGLSDGALGALGTAFTLLYAFVGVPLGRLADKGGR